MFLGKYDSASKSFSSRQINCHAHKWQIQQVGNPAMHAYHLGYSVYCIELGELQWHCAWAFLCVCVIYERIQVTNTMKSLNIDGIGILPDFHGLPSVFYFDLRLKVKFL